MRRSFILSLFAAIFLLSACMLVGCKEKTNKPVITEAPFVIENGGFETGDLTGWTVDGAAFQEEGIVSNEKVDGENAGKAGEYFFNGLESGLPLFVGSMRSGNFEIGGTGYVSFLLGAGKNTEKCYVNIKDANTDEVLFKQANTVCDGVFLTTQMLRYVIDLTEHIGKFAYFEIVDHDDNEERKNLSYLVCDDFVSYIENADLIDQYNKERQDKLELLLPEQIDEDKTRTTILNPSFESGDMSGWRLLSAGKGFGDKNIQDATATFFGNRSYHAAGDYFFDGYKNSTESDTGSMRSSYFTLSGDGYISFLLGGAKTSDCYVALCDESGKELMKVTNTVFTDPNISLNLTRFYMDASAYIGKVVAIKIVDNDERGGDYAAISVDDFRVSLTEQDVVDVMVETYNEIMALPSNSVNDYLKRHYTNYDYPFDLPFFIFDKKASGKAIHQSASVDVTKMLDAVAEKPGVDAEDISYVIEKITYQGTEFTGGFTSFDMSKVGVYNVRYYASYKEEKLYENFNIDVAETGAILNGGFETGDLAGWTVLTPDTVKADNAISSDSYDWNKAAFNKGGTYFLNGREATYSEAGTFRMRSSAFTLSGSGFITFKMGGRTAELYVYKKDGSLISKYTNTKFLDKDAFIDLGSRLSTMSTYIADLSEYMGEELYIEIADGAGDKDWALAMFDDINVRHETQPTEAMFDSVMIYKTVQVNGKNELDDKLSEYKMNWVIAENKHIVW